jgi:hypothetical protein
MIDNQDCQYAQNGNCHRNHDRAGDPWLRVSAHLNARALTIALAK